MTPVRRLCLGPGLVVEYDVTGTGPPVVLIPGLGCRRSVWGETADFLSAQFQVYAYDLRGYAGEAPPGPFTLSSLAGDLDHFVTELNLPPIHLVGHSEGGFIALEFALARPEKVGSLSLAASAAYTDAYGRELLRNWRSTATGLGAGALAKELLLWNFSPGYFNDRTREAQILKLVATRNQIDVAAYLQHNLACEGHETRSRLAGLRRPVLLLGGSDDIVMTLRHNRLLSELLPSARLVTLKGLGHHLFAEDAPRVLPHLATFLHVVARPAEAA